MQYNKLALGLGLGLLLVGCGDDGSGEEGAATSSSTGNTTSSSGMSMTSPMTMTMPDDTTGDPPGTTTDDPGTTTDDPGTTTEATGTTTDDPGTTTSGGMGLSFEMDVWPIISSNCSCHVRGGPAELEMPDASTAYANLVGVGASQAPLERVEAGVPDDSYLWNKLIDAQDAVGGSGDQMPRNAPPLMQPDLDTIEQWIIDGAAP